MVKRMQEQKGEEITVAKSRLMASSSSSKDPIASKSPVKLMASGKPESRVRRNSKPDAASSSQVKLQDAYLGGLMEKIAEKPVATDANQVLWEFSESESWSNHESEVTEKLDTHEAATGKPVASSNSGNSGNPQVESRNWPHNFHMSPAVVPRMDTVFSILRSTTESPRTTLTTSTWTRLFGAYFWIPLFKLQFILVKTMRRIYDLSRVISGCLWNSFLKTLKNWSRIRQKSMVCPRLITKSTHGDRQFCCVTKLIRSRMPKPTSSPTRRSVSEAREMNQSKLGRTKLNGMWGILWQADGVRVENMPQDSQRRSSLRRFKKLMEDLQCEPEHFNDRIIFMSMCIDIVWRKKETQKGVNIVHRQLLAVVGNSWDLGKKRNGTEPTLINPTESLWQNCWTNDAALLQEPVIQNFVPPAPWKEESQEAKKKVRSPR